MPTINAIFRYDLSKQANTSTVRLPFIELDGFVDWGDGSTEYVGGISVINHTFGVPGAIYTITVLDANQVIMAGIDPPFGLGLFYFEYVTPMIGVEYMNGIFENGSNLETAIFRSGASHDVIAMQDLFANCTSLTTVTFESNTTSNLQYTDRMFKGCTKFNQDLGSNFNTSSVISMQSMFQGCTAYNKPLPASFNTASVVSFSGMFSGCSSFNSELPAAFTGSSATSMADMFKGCAAFNQAFPDNFATTSSLFDMTSMFEGCTAFNQAFPAGFNTSGVISMISAFQTCRAFNQSLTSFSPVSMTNANNMLADCGMSPENYSNLLNAWAAYGASLKTGVPLGANNLQYTAAGLAGRNTLVNTYNWMITGDSMARAVINNICFTAGTPIHIDGHTLPVRIECVEAGKHRVGGRMVEHVTATKSTDSHVVCIDQGALGANVPSQPLTMSKKHKLMFDGNMVAAETLVGKIDGVFLRKYRGEPLFSVLLEGDAPGKMNAADMECETLDPSNSVAKLYRLLPTLPTAADRDALIAKANERILSQQQPLRA